MLIIPAIDIMGGKCVRLLRGDFEEKKVYNENPIFVAEKFAKQGAPMLHVIDLDGAKAGYPVNQNLIAKMRKKVKIPLQVGGGIRQEKDARFYLDSGIERIVIGTVAASDQKFLQNLVNFYGAKSIIVAIDIENGNVVTNGWQKNTALEYRKFAKNLKKIGISEIIATDISRDGTLTSPNFEMISQLKNLGLKVIASGGISNLRSLQILKKLNIEGAIIGKALYEGKILLCEALKNSALTKRIIPCLDVKDGRVVKGKRFLNLKDAGDPGKLGEKYSKKGADELVFLDITASKENRDTIYRMVEKVAKKVSIPFTVGGGIKSVEEMRRILKCGADKITINTAAILNPKLIKEGAKNFGSQCIVVAIDAKKVGKNYKVFIKGGSEETELDAIDWAKKVEKLGAGEILLTSMDRDGIKQGYDLKLIEKVSTSVNIPVIASGGAGTLQHLLEAFEKGKADSVLLASMLHFQEVTIAKVKKFLRKNGISIRM